MEIRDINKTIEVATLKKRKRRCKIMGLVWFGTSAVTAGILAPILLAQPNDKPGIKNTNTGTPGTGTPTHNLKTGYVYGGHIYDSEDKAKAKLVESISGEIRPATDGTLDYSIDGVTKSDGSTTFEKTFASTQPTPESIYKEYGFLGIDIDKMNSTLLPGETASTIDISVNSHFVAEVAAKVGITNPFIKYSLNPTNDASDYTDTLTGINIGRYSDGVYKYSGGTVQGFDNSWMETKPDGTAEYHNPSPRTESTYFEADRTEAQYPSGAYIMETQRVFGKLPAATLASYAIRFDSPLKYRNKDGNIVQMQAGPVVYLYTNLTKAAWETMVSTSEGLQKLSHAFVGLDKKTGTPPTSPDSVKDWEVVAKAHPTATTQTVVGVISSVVRPEDPSSKDIVIDTSSIVGPIAAGPWTVNNLTPDKLSLITKLDNVEFHNGQKWDLTP